MIITKERLFRGSRRSRLAIFEVLSTVLLVARKLISIEPALVHGGSAIHL